MGYKFDILCADFINTFFLCLIFLFNLVKNHLIYIIRGYILYMVI